MGPRLPLGPTVNGSTSLWREANHTWNCPTRRSSEILAPTRRRITVRIAGTVATQFGKLLLQNQPTICKLLASRQRQILEYHDTYPATKTGKEPNGQQDNRPSRGRCRWLKSRRDH